MKDIAADLGVSLMTVSKALRNHSDVADETRRRVIERAQQLGYEPNLNARSLASNRSYLIGLIVPDMMHSFFAEVAKGIDQRLEPLGYQILISNSGESAETELRQLKMLLGRNVDGVILASAAKDMNSPVADVLTTRGAAYVLIDRMIPGLKANYVGVKDDEIGKMATAHLIAQGCKRIAHLRGPLISTGIGRLRGYRNALAEEGLKARPEHVLDAAHGDDTGYSAMRKLLALPSPPDGVFCFNDPVAAGAIKAILEAGLDVPRDIAVIGAGDVHYSDLLRVPLSTISQSSLLIGRRAADLLLEMMEHKHGTKVRRILIPPQLVVRDSTAAKVRGRR